MRNQLLLGFLFLCVFPLFSQAPPQFAYPASCQPNLFGPDPLIYGDVRINGVPADIGNDYFAFFNQNDDVIFSGPIQAVQNPSTMSTYAGFGFKIREEVGGNTCAGFNSTDPVYIVLFDADDMTGCGFKTAPNGTFVITKTSFGGQFVVDGPDGDASVLDTFDFVPSTCVTALPVDFAVFSAREVENDVQLDWITGREIDNSHFEVETSTDGQSWERIGTVAGSGTSDRPNAYRFVDNSPALGQNLYRIKQVDFDGSFDYSSIATVTIDGRTEVAAAVFPNPITTNSPTLSLSGDWAEQTDALLYDTQGRIVARFQGLTAGSQTIDLPELPAGVYQLIVGSGAQREVVRLLLR